MLFTIGLAILAGIIILSVLNPIITLIKLLFTAVKLGFVGLSKVLIFILKNTSLLYQILKVSIYTKKERLKGDITNDY